MQALKKFEQKKEDLVENAKEMLQPTEEDPENQDTMDKLKEDAKEMAEDVVDSISEKIDEVMPKAERLVSTMNRKYSIYHAFKTEVECCWQHSHWGWARTILGPNLLIPADEDSEWAFIRQCFRTWTLGPLIQLFLLSFGSIFFPPMGFFLLMYLWERSYTTEVGSDEAFKSTVRNKERWIFVNGMCVDNNLGYGNALQLSKLFNRQVQFFHNPTQGLLFDFFECMVGRTFNFQTPVSRSLAKCLTTAINGPHEKVVLVAHSQGGIISSNAVELLIKRGVPVDRLEVYTFGSAADEFMQVYDKKTQKSYPYYEHYAHEEDFVAQIGILHWHIPGNVYTAKKIGHFMGDHYLPSFKNKEFSLYCGMKREPKLYKYMDNAKKEELQKENPVQITKSVKTTQHTTTNRKTIHNNDKIELSPHSPSPAKALLSSSPPSDTTKPRALSAQE